MRGLPFSFSRNPRAPLNASQKVHNAERLQKDSSRTAQGWAKQRPLTCQPATRDREGFLYERDEHGTIRKSDRYA